jgi:VWFA-related protein
MKHKKAKNRWFIPVFILLVLFSAPIIVGAAANVKLVVHFIEGQPLKDQIGYSVNIYLSVLDGSGKSIANLEKQNFKISENSRQVQLESVALSTNMPMNTILLMDTSGSMQGQPIGDARRAASSFVNKLAETDKIAIAGFDKTINYFADFTSDRQAVLQKIGQMEAVNLANTCLYDAAYSAVQKSATLSSGQRAIILLTDGNDTCSIHTIEDVIGLASQGSTRVPIFTIGLGTDFDSKTLDRLSQMTGGTYNYAPNSSQLTGIFDQLASQLRTQYVLNYISTSAPGSHTLVIEAQTESGSAQDSRSFLLPALPTKVIILSPAQGQTLSGKVKIAATVTGLGEPVEKVVIQVNDKEIGSIITLPYELEWDTSTSVSGSNIINVIAQDKEGKTLSSSSVTVNVNIGKSSGSSQSLFSNPFFLTVLGVLLIGGVAALVIVKKRKKDKLVNTDEDALELKKKPDEDGDKTIDFQPSDEILATLTILFSEEVGQIGQSLNITKFPSAIGREDGKAKDIRIPKEDKAVSRNHATIDHHEGKIVLIEEVTNKSGKLERPPYGTFINEKKIGSEPVELHNGDEIRLGSRFKMRFNIVSAASDQGDSTRDFSLEEEKNATREVNRDENSTREIPGEL